MIKVSIISTGSELIVEKNNTNLHYIAKKLQYIGLKVDYNITVPDKKSLLKNALKFCNENSQVIIITGGLGPTFDDVTVEAVSDFTGKEIVFNEEVYKNIEKYFSNKKVEIPPLAKRQANVISDAEVLPNKHGLAPGQKIVFNKNVIYLLPGPPRELVPLFEEYVFPQLKKYECGFTKECTLHICGIPESKIEEVIKPVLETEKYSSDITFSILPHLNIVDLKIKVSSENELIVSEELLLVKKEIYDCFSKSFEEGRNIVFGENGETLEYAVGMLLAKKKKTLGVAESCTAGMIAERITRVPGSSLYFYGGVVAYSNTIKTNVLGVRSDVLETYGAVSEQVVEEMAKGVRRIFDSDYSLSVSGVAGPGGGSKDKPVGTVWFCIYDGQKFITKQVLFKGTRQEVREQATNFMLEMLRKKILFENKK